MKYFEHFLDDFFLPICLVIVGGWLSLRQAFIFNEHKNIMNRLNALESENKVFDIKIDNITNRQCEIKDSLDEVLKILRSVEIKQASYHDEKH